jgi:hypothetical protein
VAASIRTEAHGWRRGKKGKVLLLASFTIKAIRPRTIQVSAISADPGAPANARAENRIDLLRLDLTDMDTTTNPIGRRARPERIMGA